MAIEDLDLEFEDENEIESSDALDVDIDLSFSASKENSKNVGAKPASAKTVSALEATNPNLRIPPSLNSQNTAKKPTAPTNAQSSQPRQPTQPSSRTQAPQANVKNIADHKRAVPQEMGRQVQQVRVQQQRLPETQAYAAEDVSTEIQLLRDEIQELRAQVKSIEQDANVKVAVAEAKSEFIIDYVSDAKLASHQINQVLQMIHKKVPGLKPEVLSIKKAMDEFIEKTTKKKN